MNAPTPELLKQHVIDPEICIRCNTCEETCPVDAVTHDGNNYVVDASICNHCMDCISPCPTGSITCCLSSSGVGAFIDASLCVRSPYTAIFTYSNSPGLLSIPTLGGEIQEA